MSLFARPSAMMVRSSPSVQFYVSRKPPFPSRQTSLASCLYQSSLAKPSSAEDYRQNWVNVIEEYKKDKEQLAKDLGVAESGNRIRDTNIPALETSFVPTKAEFINSVASDIVLGVVLLVGSYCYYMITGKERPSRKRKVLADEGSPKVEGDDGDIWSNDAEAEETWKERDG